MEGSRETVFTTAARRAEIKVEREELVLVEFRYEPRQRGPNPHIHHHHSDAFYVLEGELTVEVAGEPVVLGPGGFALAPPGVVHTFRNDSEVRGRFLNLHTPGCGFADYLRGENPDFDQHEPPEDGGRPRSEAVVLQGTR